MSTAVMSCASCKRLEPFAAANRSENAVTITQKEWPKTRCHKTRGPAEAGLHVHSFMRVAANWAPRWARRPSSVSLFFG